ncbi:MAG: type II toxin-antitoxin system HicA family toxin [Solirubrobacterales bacterium]
MLETTVRASDDRRVPWKVREVEKKLRREGWAKFRQSGSHQVWKSRDGTRTAVVAGKASDTLSPGTLANIRRASGIEEFR